MRIARGLFSFLFLVAFAGAAPGEPPSPSASRPDSVPRATASVELSLFNLDVVVTDSKGNPVHGLTRADFEVRHDGKLVDVTNFSEYRGEPAASTQASTSEPARAPVGTASASPRPPRRLVLFFDRLDLPEPQTRKALFDSLRSLLARTLDGGDEAMIVTWNRSIRTVLPFTDDLDSLERSLAAIERQSAHVGTEQADFELVEAEDAWFASLAADPRVGASGAGGKLTDELLANQAFFEMKAKTAALKGLTATLGGTEGRKVLVFVSHRFSRRPGLEFLVGSRPETGAVVTVKARQRDALGLLEEVARSANANGVTLYTLFPAGFDTTMPSAVDPGSSAPPDGAPAPGARGEALLANEMEGLDFVASRTGGVALAGPQSISRFAERVSADLESWYSLGYPSRSGAGRAAPVSVRMKDRSLKARLRSSLVEKSLEEQMSDRVLAHLFRPDARATIPISVTAGATADGKGKFRIRLDVKIPINSLVLLQDAKGAHGSFSVFVASVAPEGDFSTVTRRSQAFEIPESDLETAKAGHYTYLLDIETNGPDARVCVGVWDERGNEAGFAIVTPSRT